MESKEIFGLGVMDRSEIRQPRKEINEKERYVHGAFWD
jgi:hypothetical protein